MTLISSKPFSRVNIVVITCTYMILVVLSKFIDESPTENGIRYLSKIRKLYLFFGPCMWRIVAQSEKIISLGAFFPFVLSFINLCIIYTCKQNGILNLSNALETESYVVGKNKTCLLEEPLDHSMMLKKLTVPYDFQWLTLVFFRKYWGFFFFKYWGYLCSSFKPHLVISRQFVAFSNLDSEMILLLYFFNFNF